MTPRRDECIECGEEMETDASGMGYHLSADTVDGTDGALDADHVATPSVDDPLYEASLGDTVATDDRAAWPADVGEAA